MVGRELRKGTVTTAPAPGGAGHGVGTGMMAPETMAPAANRDEHPQGQWHHLLLGTGTTPGTVAPL